MSKEIARKWYKQAIHDLEMAERNIQIEGYDVAAFLAHQAVEKLLKCLLILEGKEVPQTHKLDRLINLLNLSSELSDKILDLTEDYTISRYPDVSLDVPYLQYNRAIAQRKVSIAKEAFDVLKKKYKDLEFWSSEK
jgi:HEPN domain-containing protein